MSEKNLPNELNDEINKYKNAIQTPGETDNN
jgi:hypothetical protein